MMSQYRDNRALWCHNGVLCYQMGNVMYKEELWYDNEALLCYYTTLCCHNGTIWESYWES